MRRLITILVLLAAISLNGLAQYKNDGQRFSKEEFVRQLEQYVAHEAQLTSKEQAEFFPIFREMHLKMRKVFDAMKKIDSTCPSNDKACAAPHVYGMQYGIEGVLEGKLIDLDTVLGDKMDIELKRIQQQYHNKFLDILPACKVMKAIKAEDKFHRNMLKRWSKVNRKK